MDCQKLEKVTSFKYLGATLCKDGTYSAEVRIRISSAMVAMATLNRIWLSWAGLGYAFGPSGTAATDTPRVTSSRYRLARLRVNMTLPARLCLMLLETIF